MAKLLASGLELTLANAILHVPLPLDEATGKVYKSGDFSVDGVLENGVGVTLTGAVSRRSMLIIAFDEAYGVDGSVASLIPHNNKSIHLSPRDGGYAVAYDLLGAKASFLVSPSPERITLMMCEAAPPKPQPRNPDEMTPFEKFTNLLTALRRQHVPFRLDRHGPDGVTVTFVWADQLIEACFEDDGKMWFSHFCKSLDPLDAEGVMKLIDDNWRDPPRKERRDQPDWRGVKDPFAHMLAFTRMLDDEGINWRMDSFDGRSASIFLTLVSMRIEAQVDHEGMTFAAYFGAEDVFPQDHLQALVPGLSLDR